jgi:serine/threonine-protein kinase RsbW
VKPQLNILKNELVIPSSTNYLADVRNFVEMNGLTIGLEQKTISHISLAVDEACTNIIKHAYNNSDKNEILIKINTSEKSFKITLIDTGEHFNPVLIAEPDIEASQKKKKGGGLGMFLMKKLMDEVKYNVSNNKNELLLIKYLN